MTFPTELILALPLTCKLLKSKGISKVYINNYLPIVLYIEIVLVLKGQI